jgi:hypothetical protein
MVRALERRITFGAKQRGHPASGLASIWIKNQQPRRQWVKTKVKHV